jgi:uncharacterized membrane protein
MTTDQSTASTDRTDHDQSGPISTSTMRYLYIGALTLAGLIAFISVIQAYISAGRAINEFVSSEYQPVFQTGFNLIVLSLSAIVISRLGRRLAVLSASDPTGTEQPSMAPSTMFEEEPDTAAHQGAGDASSTPEVGPADTESTSDSDATPEPGDAAETAATDWGGSEDST